MFVEGLIRFRVWTGLKMEYDVVAGRFGHFYVNPGHNGDGLDPDDSASLTGLTTKYYDYNPLMQWIGYVDRNGKDIYERDIVVSVCTGKVGQISKPFIVTSDSYKLLDNIAMYSFCYEVIGNVYENPELTQERD